MLGINIGIRYLLANKIEFLFRYDNGVEGIKCCDGGYEKCKYRMLWEGRGRVFRLNYGDI